MKIHCILIAILYLTIACLGNTATASSDSILDVRVNGESGEFRKVIQAISEKYNIRIGFIANQVDRVKISFRKGTLRDALNKIVAQRKDYQWQIENGIIYLYPLEEKRAKEMQLLNSEIDGFSFRKGYKIDDLRFLLHKDKRFSQSLNRLKLRLQLFYRLYSVSNFRSEGIGTDEDIVFNDTKLIDILNQLTNFAICHIWEIEIDFNRVHINIY